ncbi:MAG: alpha/beta fold hydrolase [Caldilinea sp. CFX5]|nr:alpha/beta fold hydrolase [Caldilinea sp. CFX5]
MKTLVEPSHAPSPFARTRVAFVAGGVNCAGYLYRPAVAGGSTPCVVMANGFSNTMDWILPAYAERFAAAGFAVLLFDYRHFGESEGKPRQLVSVKRQREDIGAAIRFARAQADLDPNRIALWGTSLGGGHVIAVAAADPRIAAVIAQAPGIDMVSKEARATIKVPPVVIRKLLTAAVRDAIQGLFGLPPYYAKVFGEPGEAAVFTAPELKPRFAALMQGSATWRNQFTPRFYLALPRYQPGTAERLVMPLLVCVADQEVYANPAFQVKIGQQAPRGEVRHYPGEHFDLYHGLFAQVIADEIDFLQRHLFTTASSPR